MKELVGWLTVPRPVVVRTQHEVAAWYTDSRVAAGRYPIWREGSGESAVWSLPLPGVIVAENTPALYCGVPVGRAPQGKNHTRVGRPHTCPSLWWRGSFYLSGLGRSVVHGLHLGTTGLDAVRCPVQLLRHSVGTESRWHVTSVPHLSMVGKRHNWSEGWRGYWMTFYRITETRALPSGTDRAKQTAELWGPLTDPERRGILS